MTKLNSLNSIRKIFKYWKDC